MHPTGGLACNPGLCPDEESNRRPFDSQVGTQSTEPHQPGQAPHFDLLEFQFGLSTYLCGWADWALLWGRTLASDTSVFQCPGQGLAHSGHSLDCSPQGEPGRPRRGGKG